MCGCGCFVSVCVWVLAIGPGWAGVGEGGGRANGFHRFLASDRFLVLLLELPSGTGLYLPLPDR